MWLTSFLSSWIALHLFLKVQWCITFPIAFEAGTTSKVNIVMTQLLKHKFFELKICLYLPVSFSSTYFLHPICNCKLISLCCVLLQRVHFWFIACCWSVLKFLSPRVGDLAYSVSFTRSLLTYYCITSLSLNNSLNCNSILSLTKSGFLTIFLVVSHIPCNGIRFSYFSQWLLFFIGLRPQMIGKTMITCRCVFATSFC